MTVKVRSFVKEVQKRMEDEAKKKAIEVGNAIRNKVLEGMRGPWTGKTYRVPGTARTYTASAPGEYPAVRLGALKASIKMVVRQDLYGVYAVVGTLIPYAKYLEGRGPNDPGIRPFLSKAYAEALPEIRRILGQEQEG